MDHFIKEKYFTSSKLGFHYFLDDERFKQEDARLWIKKLEEINANWLVINNPKERAIPEEFIRAFSKSDINLIINFNQQLCAQYDLKSIQPFLSVYGRWGVKYACLFERPNKISSWGEFEWNNHDVVETHLKKFIQFSQSCVENKIKPIFSPLFPGGDYWDLAFLEESLKGLAFYAAPHILNNVILSAYGWRWGHTIEWGAGGKQKCPEASPFLSDQEGQNQKSFRAYEWYLEVSEKVLGKKLPIIIFEAGLQNEIDLNETGDSPNRLNDKSIIPNLLAGGNVYDPQHPDQLLSPIPDEVIGCNLFILSAHTDKSLLPYRWFSSVGDPLETAKAFSANKKDTTQNYEKLSEEIDNFPENIQFKYRRYILVSDSLKPDMPNLLERLDLYIRKYRPQVGFSKMDALNAAYILVVTENKESFPFDQSEGQTINSVVKVITPNEINELQGEK